MWIVSYPAAIQPTKSTILEEIWVKKFKTHGKSRFFLDKNGWLIELSFGVKDGAVQAGYGVRDQNGYVLCFHPLFT